jgi:phosphonate transport system substrate-binding protein
MLLVNYLAKRLATCSDAWGQVKTVETMDKMIDSIKNKEVDIYMDSMYPAFLVSNATGAQPILRRWRNCDPEYYSVIFTTADSGITSIEDLPGHMVAMDQIYSTSGFVLPAAYLLDKGLKLVLKDSWAEPVAADEVGIIFSNDDVNTLNFVRDGKAVAGATDDFYINKWEKEGRELETPITFVRLAETISVQRQAVLVRSDLGSDLQEAIKRKLANAHLDPEGLKALKLDADTCKFDDPPDMLEAAFEQMQQMHNKVKEIPGWQEAFELGN